MTDFRNNLHACLAGVQKGEPLAVLSRGKVIARIIPPEDEKENAKARLASLRASAWEGDVETPMGDLWDAQPADS